MTTKHLRKKLIEDAPAKTKGASITVSYQVLANTREDKMSDDEFNKAMAALEDIWNSCPKDLPKDLSKKHDQYLFGERK